MMKSNSLTNRILALALTVVMLLGMLPSGMLAAAEEADSNVAKASVEGVETEFATLAEAVAAADAGTTVTLLRNASGAGVVVNKSVTIDFGGYTYTLTEGVGSSGTPTNGLQLLAGNSVTLKNGTLKVADEAKDQFYILVQNYAGLTVSGMVLDGTNLDKWSGTDGDSYALSINSGTVAISGSTIIANNEGAKAFAFDVCQYSSYPVPSVTVYSGYIQGKVDTSSIGGASLTVQGGKFTVPADVANYLAEGYRVDEYGSVVVATNMCKIGETYYTSLQDAVAAAKNGDTIELVESTSGPGVVVNKSITIDFGGYTYTLTEGVGSSGTPTNGLQLLAGNSVALRNGTLKAADSQKNKFYILVQNYANLAVSNMTLDGTNLDRWSGTDGDSYALSINSGTVTLDGTTIIANDEGALAYAFDVCQYSSYPVPNVTVNSGSIQGKVDTSSIGAASLTVKGGSYTVPSDVEPYVAEGYEMINGTVRMKTVVTACTGGTVTTEADGTIRVVAEGITLEWSDATAYREGGWWAGIKVQAPKDADVQNATYYSGENGPESFWDNKDSDSDPHYIQMWMLLNHDIIENDDDGIAVSNYKFDWDGDGVYEQTVIFQVDLASLTLTTEDQEIAFTQSEVTMHYGDTVPANDLTGDAEGATFTSSNPEVAYFDENGQLVVVGVGSTTITATKAAYNQYNEATASYTLTVEKRPVTIYLNSCVKTYTDANPQLTYWVYDEVLKGETKDLKTYVRFDTIEEGLVAGTYDITAAEAYVVEGDAESANYAVTVVPGVLTIKKADRTAEFGETAPVETFGKTEYQNTIQFPYVGEPSVTYTVETDGIEASIEADGTLKIMANKAIQQNATIKVKAVVAEDGGYNACEATYTLTIQPLDTADNVFVTDGEQGENGWYISTVKLAPSDTNKYQIGFAIQDGEDWLVPASWNDSVTLEQQGEHDYVVFLKDTNGAISAPLTIQGVKIDVTDPELDVQIDKNVFTTIVDKIFFITQSAFDVTVSFADTDSDIVSVKIEAGAYSADLTAAQIEAHSCTFKVEPQYRNEIVVTVTNESGRETVYDTDEIFVVDDSTNIVARFDGEYLVIKGDNDESEADDIFYSADENFKLTYTLEETNLDLTDGKLTVQVNQNEAQAYDLQADQTLAFELKEAGTYTITASFTDVAGNSSTVVRNYVVDADVPVIHDLAFTSEPTEVNVGTEENPDMIFLSEDEKLYVDITVTDINYGLTGETPVVELDGEAVDLTWNSTSVEGVAGAYASLALPEQGLHEITVTYSDGFHSVERSYKVCMDFEAPVIDFNPEPNAVNKGTEAEPDITYYTDDTEFVVDLAVTDFNYGVTLDRPVVTLDGSEVEVNWTENAADDAAGVKGQITLTEEGHHTITVTYTDGLHEVTETYKVCLDFTDPVIDVKLSQEQKQDDTNGDRVYYNGNVTASITITEANFDPALVQVAVTALQGNGTTPVTVEDFSTLAVTPALWTDGENDTHTLKLTFTQDANYTLTVNYTDYAQNPAAEQQKLFTIDRVSPSNIVVGYSPRIDHGVLDQVTLGFFNALIPCDVTITAADETAGIRTFTVTSSDPTFRTMVVNAAHIGNNLYSAQFNIPAQYNGTLTVTANDWAACASEPYADGYRAIVDTVAPTNQMELNDEVKTVDDVKYFDGDIVLNISIFEANYAFFQDAVVTVTKDGKNYDGGQLGDWVRAATATNTLTLNEDGDYEITVTYTDGSQNAMAAWSSGKLTLDTKAPEIKVSNIKNNSANKDETYGFTITVTDVNLDAESVKPVLSAVVKGEDGLYTTKQIDLGAAQISADGDTVTYTVANLDQDALYTLTCIAEDMSDNASTQILLDDGQSYERVSFSINRDGSTYGFGSDYTANLVNQYYVYSVNEDVVIVEVNVDPIENYVLTVNGTELVDGIDYTTEQTANEGEWSKRTYTIKKALFTAEGQYNIIVSSTDKANTTSYSDVKNLAVSFVVDQTAPILTITGLQASGRYQTNEQIVTLIPTDEGGRLNSLKAVVLDSDGNPLTDENGNDISVRFDYAGEELLKYLEENGGMVTFTIPSGLEHQVQIICNDCAVNAEGLTNEFNEIFERVTVSTNALIIFYANKGAFYGTIGGTVGLAAVIAVLLKRKKAK